MGIRVLTVGWIVSAVVAAAEEAPRAIQVAEPPAQAESPAVGEVMSRSNQFRISGGDGMTRGMAALLAEDAKVELLHLTEEKDEWKVPVAIMLHGKAGDPPPPRTLAMQLLIVAGVNELRIDKHLCNGLETERFERAVTGALLYERALKGGAGGDDDVTMKVPPWLLEGLREATAWRLNESDRRLYATLFKQGGLFKIDDLFAVDENSFETMDGATRPAFRVSSGALVMALLEQPQGREGFRAFLTEVPAYEGEMPVLLRKHFPELNLSETSLAKWWALQLANKGALNLLTDTLTIAETEAALAEALRLDFRTEEGIVQQKEFSAWPELAALDDAGRVAALRQAHDGLTRLSFRCFPSYRPLLIRYQEIFAKLVSSDTGEVAQGLAELDETRATMIGRASRARDYLDWFEISRARRTSGAFDDYLRLKKELENNPHRRKDGLSEYLDRMDAIFHREEEARERGMEPEAAGLPPLLE